MSITVSVKEVVAQKTVDSIKAMKIDGVIAQYTTYFDGENSNRVTNIKTASKKIDGLILAPGQEFSFNKIVGERTSSAGYQPAKVIVANKFVEALGGGICQVSSTLYNTILLANLKLNERHNHSLAISYVPLGRDAAVAWNLLDFKFANSLDGHIYLRTVVGRDYITVQVFGNTAVKKDITIRSWVYETIEPEHILKADPDLLPGEEVLMEPGYKGFKAHTERIIKENGDIIKTETLPDSNYLARARVVSIAPQQHKEEQGQQLAPSKRPSENLRPDILTEF